MAESLSAATARRMLLAAQGFGAPRPEHVGTRRLDGAIRRLGLLQLDSVNVYERSHYLPLQARLGAYDKALLDRLAFRAPGRYTEYWAHEAAIIPVEDLPLWRWRMAQFRERDPWFPEFAGEHASLIRWLLDHLAERGPLAASEIEHEANRRSGPWWGWSAVKTGLEHLFRWGEVASAGRRRFERRYALPEHVLPAEVVDTAVPKADAIRELVSRSAMALGVGTIADLADYYRLRADDTRAAVRDLEDAGVLIPVAVEGWRQKAWRHRDARRPRAVVADALLSPFDPVVWDRDRALRHFGFHYRIEIYTPAPKRVYGYYSLPILLDERLVGRIDLKSDRKAGVLRVRAAWREESESGAFAEPHRIARLLREAAAWQGLAAVEIADDARGSLVADLRGALPRVNAAAS